MASGQISVVTDHKGISRGKCKGCACNRYIGKPGSNKCGHCSCPSSKHEAENGCIGAQECTCKEYVSIPGTKDCYTCGHLPKEHKGLGRVSVPGVSGLGTTPKQNYNMERSIRFSDMVNANKGKRMMTFGTGYGKGKRPRNDPNIPTFRKSIKLQLKRPKLMNCGKKRTYVDAGDQQQVAFNKPTTLDSVLKAGAKLFLDINEGEYDAELQKQGIDIFLLDGKAKVTDPSYTFNRTSFHVCYVKASERSYGSLSQSSLTPTRNSKSQDVISVDYQSATKSQSNPRPSTSQTNDTARPVDVNILTKTSLMEMGKSVLPPSITIKDAVYQTMTFDLATQTWQPLGLISISEKEEEPFAKGGMRQAYKAKFGSLSNANPLLQGFQSGKPIVIKTYLPSLKKKVEESGRILKNVAMKEVQTQMVAGQLARQFKAKVNGLPSFGSTFNFEILPCFLLEEVNTGQTEPVFMEEALEGDFRKYLNNRGVPTRQGSTEAGQVCQAFAHWCLCYTDGKMSVTDLQGVGLKLTDVEVSTSESGYYGIGNLGQETLEKFKEQHTCGEICKGLQLESFVNEDDNNIEESQFML